MANSRNYWTSLNRDRLWCVTQEGTGQVMGMWLTQEAAWEACKRLARFSRGEAFLKGRDGSIRLRETYGNDPVRSVG